MKTRMTKTKIKTDELAHLIAKDFSLEKASDVTRANTESELLKALTAVLNYLLEKDFNNLLNILYRIDVDEQKVKEIFALEAPVAPELAKAILERQKQKIFYRTSYGKNS